MTFSSLISLVLHAGVFLLLSRNALLQTAQFGVEAGATTYEIHMVAAPSSGAEVEMDDKDAIIIKKKKKHEKQPPVLAQTKTGTGTSESTVQSTAQNGAQTDAKPNYLKNPAPAYPMRARNQGQQGLVELLVEVNSDGTVKDLKLKKSSGYFMLDDAAISAVRNWEFLPANSGGVLVESKVEVPVRFKIANGSSEISLKN